MLDSCSRKSCDTSEKSLSRRFDLLTTEFPMPKTTVVAQSMKKKHFHCMEFTYNMKYTD